MKHSRHAPVTFTLHTWFRVREIIMKIVKAHIVGVLSLMLMPALGHASSGTEGAAFLDIPVGAGPAAMGAAYTALATNAYAPTWNPAGLGRLTGTELAAQHLSYLESMNYEYLSFVHPLNAQDSETHRGIGFSMQYLGSGDINRTGIDTSGNLIDNQGAFSSHY